jgi:hypothetical protein
MKRANPPRRLGVAGPDGVKQILCPLLLHFEAGVRRERLNEP